MKVSLKWLSEYVDIRLSPKELAERLTMAGMEARGIQTVGSTWNKIVIGQVTAVGPHPNADRLKLATVNLGTQQLTVVCGAPNINIKQKVAFANTGARLIDGHTGKAMILKPAKIRGILSEGMVCSEKELGISDNHENILVLPSDAPVGMSLDYYLGDIIFDLDITPNRPDCLSLIGIAREIAALTGQQPHLPDTDYEETEATIDSFISIDIADPNLCPRYCASLITGVKPGPSPDWLQQRLRSYGMRPISNIVDVTNYVMLEYGQPLHGFDYHKLRGKQLIIRRARDGELIITLDGEARPLTQDTLVIADAEKPVAIAGIMGGLDAEVTDTTTAILLESANFNRSIIRRGANRLNLQSEASIRFDKGLSLNLPLIALKRATKLLLELAGRKAARGIIDAYPGKVEPKAILLSTKEVKRLSGLEVTIEEIITVLKLLGFECQETSLSSQTSVFSPFWRSDIKCAADLVEEIVRIIGYDKIPITRLSAPLPAQKLTRELILKQKLRNTLAGWGFQEILAYSLTSLERLQGLSPELELPFTPLKVSNPMTKEQEYLRPSLRAGLLTSLANNQKYEQDGIRLFEIGKTFLPQGKELPQEKEMLCAVLSGTRQETSWHKDREPLDFFDAKGIAENLLKQLGHEATFEVSNDEGLLPGRSADIFINDDKVGVVGDLHPKISQAFKLPGTVCLIEIDVESLMSKARWSKQYQPIPRFPSTTRDIALVIDEQVSYQKVKDIIQSFTLVKKVMLFDLYMGEQVPEGKKSFAVRVVYQSTDHTLTDEEVNKVHQGMVSRLHQELGAMLRD